MILSFLLTHIYSIFQKYASDPRTWIGLEKVTISYTVTGFTSEIIPHILRAYWFKSINEENVSELLHNFVFS